MTKRLIVGISGASGAIYGIRLLEILAGARAKVIAADGADGAAGPIETHLIISPTARATIHQETPWKIADVEALADVVYPPHDVGAAIASGSFATIGMIVAPCSIKTLSAVAYSFDADLMARAADVQLKEGRPVLLLVRETPLHTGHLKAMLHAAENGAVIMPPVPTFYNRPQTIDEMVDATVGRALARIGIDTDLVHEWLGLGKSRPLA
jgi:4-hydroxy-3-polyprenylbenzoate decarboxylase